MTHGDARGIARSIALEANAADALPEILRRGVIPDIVTDQTSAHDALNGYVPHGMSLAEAATLRERHPQHYIERSMAVDGTPRGSDARASARAAR